MNINRIAVAGAGYVGLSQYNEVIAVDVVQEKVETDLQKFKSECDVIIANRNAEELTRDLTGRD